MNNLTQPIVVGVIVFAASQYILKLILEPIVQLRKLLSEISHTLLFNQAEVVAGNTKNEELHKAISILSAKLRSSVYLIPFYSLLNKLQIFGLPKKENILLACRELNRLSYGVLGLGKDASIQAQENDDALDKISKLLNIETSYKLNDERNP